MSETGYKIKIGFDATALKSSFKNLKSSFSNASKDLGKMAKDVGSKLKDDISGGFRGMATESKQAEQKTKSSSQGMQVGLAGLLQGMQLIGGFAKNMFNGFIEASPLASVEIAKITFDINLMKKEMGDELAPVLGIVADKIKTLKNWFIDLDPDIKSAILVAGGFALALSFVAMAFAAVSIAGAPILLIIAGVALAAGLLYLAWKKNFLGIADLVETLKNMIVKAFGENKGNIDELKDAFKAFWDKIKPIVMKIVELLKKYLILAVENLIAKFQMIIEVVKHTFDFVKKLIKGDWKGAWESFKKIFVVIWDYLVAKFQRAIDFIVDIFETFGVDIKGIWQKVADWFVSIWEGIKKGFDKIKGFFKGIGDFFKGIWDKVVGGVTGFFDKIKDKFTKIKDFFTNLFGGIKDGSMSLKDVLKSLLNVPIKLINDKVIGKLNKFLETVKGLEILGVKPFEWIKTIPSIPLMHTGGKVTNTGDYRLRKDEGVLNEHQMRAIGGTAGLRQIGTANGGITNSGSTTVIIQNVSLSGDADIENFVRALRSKDFGDFNTNGYSTRRH